MTISNAPKKPGTVIKKIYKRYNDGSIEFDELINLLEEACQQEIIKVKKSMVTKFATAYGLSVAEVEKKALTKKDRHITAETLAHYADLFSRQPILYQSILRDGKEYMSEMSAHSLIFDINEEHNAKVVGYIHSSLRPMFFDQII